MENNTEQRLVAISQALSALEIRAGQAGLIVSIQNELGALLKDLKDKEETK